MSMAVPPAAAPPPFLRVERAAPAGAARQGMSERFRRTSYMTFGSRAIFRPYGRDRNL